MTVRQEPNGKGGAVKAKLLQRAGEIPKGADVDIVSKVADRREHDRGEAIEPQTRSLSYAVKDSASHEETVDTRDLKPLP